MIELLVALLLSRTPDSYAFGLSAEHVLSNSLNIVDMDKVTEDWEGPCGWKACERFTVAVHCKAIKDPVDVFVQAESGAWVKVMGCDSTTTMEHGAEPR